MQRHPEAGHEKLPLVIPVLFYMGKRWQANSTAVLSRWLTLWSFRMMKLLAIAAWPP
ncbi:hypothetical protein GYRE_00805 [Yokenella regensburgei ATCC 49455]|nr:hypothetical protein GYRE_00805 [Yokenella regensburgei ATCC 49455]